MQFQVKNPGEMTSSGAYEYETYNIMEFLIEGAIAALRDSWNKNAPNLNDQEKPFALILRTLAKETIRKICSLHSEFSQSMQNEIMLLKLKLGHLENVLRTTRENARNCVVARPTHVVHDGILFEIHAGVLEKKTPSPLTPTESQAILNAATQQQDLTKDILHAVTKWIQENSKMDSRTEPTEFLRRGCADISVQCNSVQSVEMDSSELQQVVNKEKPNRYMCNGCDKGFTLKKHLLSHVSSVHISGKLFSCEQCGYRFKSESSLKNHLLRHKSQKKKIVEKKSTKCQVCAMTFPTGIQLRWHVNRLHPELRSAEVRPFVCTSCGKRFITKGVLKQHLVVHTHTKTFKCDKCEKCFKSLGYLLAHTKLHTDKRPFKCTVCDKAFRTNRSLTLHCSTHTGEKPFICEVCGICFRIERTLKQHVRLHTGKKPHLCEICGKGFVQASCLKTHMVSHGAPKNFVCDLCGRRFLYNNRLLKHQQLVHGGGRMDPDRHDVSLGHETCDKRIVVTEENSFVCTTCQKSFDSAGTLRTHQNSHAGQKYNCTLCEKSFVHKQTFDYHVRLHSGERPYECDVCGKAFILSQSLKSHRMLHTGEKPHKCEYCGRAFRIRNTLVRHVRTHTGEKPYECAACGKRFAQRKQANSHMRIHTVH